MFALQDSQTPTPIKEGVQRVCQPEPLSPYYNLSPKPLNPKSLSHEPLNPLNPKLQLALPEVLQRKLVEDLFTSLHKAGSTLVEDSRGACGTSALHRRVRQFCCVCVVGSAVR